MFFYNPVKIIFDVDFASCIKDIKNEFNGNFLLIASKKFSHQIEQAKSIFGKNLAGIVNDIAPNPQLQDLQNLKNTLPSNYDFIIALGGGSVLDSAKFFSFKGEICANNGSLDLKMKNPSDVGQNFAPIFAFSTTAGTSSELTKWATIWDTQNNIKYSLEYDFLYPNRAFYDCALHASLPLDVTISTSLDSLSHAIESIWNHHANPISTANALCAIDLILEFLPKLIKNLDSIILRQKIALASIYAGLAFSNTKTAIAHALSHPITMRFGVPHGIACSFSLPWLLECLDKDLVQECDNAQLAKKYLLPLKPKICNLFETISVSYNFCDYGLDSTFLQEIFATLNARARNSIFDMQKLEKELCRMIDKQ